MVTANKKPQSLFKEFAESFKEKIKEKRVVSKLNNEKLYLKMTGHVPYKNLINDVNKITDVAKEINPVKKVNTVKDKAIKAIKTGVKLGGVVGLIGSLFAVTKMGDGTLKKK
tara:strand:- start:606 stop:941 length:336 start_codon:yes stop_codon:yes gene_type:complete